MNKMTPQAAAHPDWEALSTLADGELEGAAAESLLAALCRDSALRREWITLHIVGDALRSSDVAAVHSESFCERVRAALEREPTVLAPRAAKPGRSRPLRAYLLPGAAIAASAAVIGFVAVPLLQAPPAVPPVAALAPTQTSTPTAIATSRRAATTVANARAFDVYLAAHREVATGVALPRATPYLRTPDEVPESR
jgi:sigma-E factor negative regulatory protein RseA